jgi:hypothetical protein
MQKPKNKTKKVRRTDNLETKTHNQCKIESFEEIIKVFHDRNRCNMKHKRCTMHIAHIVTLIETQKPRQNDKTQNQDQPTLTWRKLKIVFS